MPGGDKSDHAPLPGGGMRIASSIDLLAARLPHFLFQKIRAWK
jgi:hypothetical protein